MSKEASEASEKAPVVTIERPAEGIVRVVMNRPAARNALDLALSRELREALEDAQADDAVRAVVLTGAGPAFCVGGDVKLMNEAGAAGRPELLRQLTHHMHAAVLALATMPKPVVAAVRG